MRLLKLPLDVRDMVSRGELTAGHARTLITVEDPTALARKIIESGLSVREAEVLSQRGAAPKSTTTMKPPRDADTMALEKQLSDALGLSVAIDHGDKGGGKVEIRYRTLEQLDSIIAKLVG